MKKIKLFTTVCFSFILSLSSISMNSVMAYENESCDVSTTLEQNYNNCDSLNLSQLDLSSNFEEIGSGHFAHATIPATISSCASNCTRDTCNGYKYIGAHYGSNIIPYTIDQSAIDAGIEGMILDAVEQWNSIIMYDTGLPVVTLQRNGNSIDGRPVCNVVYMATRPSHIPSSVHAEFQYGYTLNDGDYLPNTEGYFRILVFDTGKDVDIIAHEFGHLLGLDDLEDHNVLMGYKGFGMQYQDIQGAALFNLSHTNHTFYRYEDLGAGVTNRYRHICYYCDGYEDRRSVASGAQLLVQDPYVCSSHTYQPMVSSIDKEWDRCTTCYKVRLAAGDLYYDNLEKHPSSPYYDLFPRLAVSGLTDASKTNIVIPNFIGGQCVTSIGDFAFSGLNNLKSVSLPRLLYEIGNSAFFNCTSLTSIELPDMVKYIEAYAFMECTNLRRINIPLSVTSMGYAPFIYCPNLTIYAEQTSAPTSGWDTTWNVSNISYTFNPYGVVYTYHTVVWGSTK